MNDKEPEYEQTRDYHMAREEIVRILTEVGKMRETIARLSGILDDHHITYEREDYGRQRSIYAVSDDFASAEYKSYYDDIVREEILQTLVELAKMRETIARLTGMLDKHNICCECGRNYEYHRYGGDCEQDRDHKKHVEEAIEELRHLITKGEEEENPEYLRGACEIIANLWCEIDVGAAKENMIAEIIEKGGLA